MTDDPGFRHEAHATVEPTPTEEIAHLRRQRAALEARLEEAERALRKIVAKNPSRYASTWRYRKSISDIARAALPPESETR